MSEQELVQLYREFADRVRTHVRADYRQRREAGEDRTKVWREIRVAHRQHLSYVDREVVRVLNEQTKREHDGE